MKHDLTLYVYCDASVGAGTGFIPDMPFMGGVGIVGVHKNNVVHIGRRIVSFSRNILDLEIEAIVIALDYVLSNMGTYTEAKVFNDNLDAIRRVNRYLILNKTRTLRISDESMRILNKVKAAQLHVTVTHQLRGTCGGIMLADKISRWVYTRHTNSGVSDSLTAVRNNHNIIFPKLTAKMLSSDMMIYRERRIVKHAERTKPEFTTVYDTSYFEEAEMEKMMSNKFKGNK